MRTLQLVKITPRFIYAMDRNRGNYIEVYKHRDEEHVKNLSTRFSFVKVGEVDNKITYRFS